MPNPSPRRARTCLAVAMPLAGAALAAHAASPMELDLAARSPAIHWPRGFTPDRADLFAHNDILIAASCADVFARLAHAGDWPAWYGNAQAVRVTGSADGRLRHGSRFAWQTFGLAVTSRVHEYVPDERLGWFGDAPDLRAYHTWLLTPRDGGCFVQSEEVVRGKGAVRLRESDPEAMHKGHDEWNAALKAVVEGRQ